jgi:hypothetical protein
MTNVSWIGRPTLYRMPFRYSREPSSMISRGHAERRLGELARADISLRSVASATAGEHPAAPGNRAVLMCASTPMPD